MACQLPPRDHDRTASFGLLAEAGWDIFVASLAIRLSSFERLAANLEGSAPASDPANAETRYWVRRAVSAWGRRLPWRAKCFEKGIAAARMLRRRGLAYELHYGAASRTDKLDAHVWVTSRGDAVVGCENADEFAPLARFTG